ncbi:MAG: hypothetical protein ABL958_17490, partial [Bdellovibrionia bacterium]
GGTPASVKIQIDNGSKVDVDPLNSADFPGLNTMATHKVSIFDSGGEKRLTSFRFKFPKGSREMCLRRKPTYGTWSIESCSCPALN